MSSGEISLFEHHKILVVFFADKISMTHKNWSIKIFKAQVYVWYKNCKEKAIQNDSFLIHRTNAYHVLYKHLYLSHKELKIKSSFSQSKIELITQSLICNKYKHGRVA